MSGDKPSILQRIRNETADLLTAVRQLDAQTTVVLLLAVLLVFVQVSIGSKSFFRSEFGSLVHREQRELFAWGWWFSMQGITGFVLPVLLLMLVFKRKPAEIGIGKGDWRLATVLALLYLPFVIAGTWVLSDRADFQAAYPHLRMAIDDWGVFAVYQLLFVFYWIGWEYLWRGFVLFGTAHTFGIYAIVVQTVPFALLHVDKPMPEAVLSVVGGLVLGAVVWRCRSFWIAVPIHAVQMLLIDFFCAVRLRNGINGVGLEAILRLFGAS